MRPDPATASDAQLLAAADADAFALLYDRHVAAVFALACGARVAATTTFNGTPAYKLSVTGGSDRWLDGTVYVSRADYRPMQIEAGGERIAFQTYEYLPATSSNLQLLK